ncbi:MAG: radical SAM protein [Acidobacteriota bacterium]
MDLGLFAPQTLKKRFRDWVGPLDLWALQYPFVGEAREFYRKHLRKPISGLSESGAELNSDFETGIPDAFIVDPGNICNLRCPFCPTGLNLQSHQRMMKLEDYQVILEKIAPFAQHIGLYNWGEPLLNKNLPEMIEATHALRIQTIIDTNLSLSDLTDAEAERLVSSGLSVLRASIDGASQESYEKYRVHGDFARTQNNLRALVAAKKRLGLASPSITWNFLINGHNESEIETARRAARDIGVRIRFALMEIWDGEKGKGWESTFHNKTSLLARLKRHVASASKDLPIPLRDLRLHDKLTPFCSQPFSVMFIAPDGHVMPCCNVWGSEYSMGNLLEEDLEEIWNGDRFRKSRAFLFRYGPRQDGGSVCETLPCPLKNKAL